MDEESQPKRLKLDDIVSEESSSSDSKESRHSSWQNASTDWVKDSGDDWSPSPSSKSASNHSFHEVEFEPESSGTDEINSTSSPSSVKEVFFDPKENCKITDENNEVGIESSEDEFILLVNLKEERKCIICSSLTINPSKYCNDCYMKRKELLPPRPRKKRKQKKKNQTKIPTNEPEDPQPSCSKSTYNYEASSDMCLGKCNGKNEVDGAFIHGKTGHQIFCYRCSVKVWKQKSTCPVCRRTIQKVVKIFNNKTKK